MHYWPVSYPPPRSASSTCVNTCATQRDRSKLPPNHKEATAKERVAGVDGMDEEEEDEADDLRAEVAVVYGPTMTAGNSCQLLTTTGNQVPTAGATYSTKVTYGCNGPVTSVGHAPGSAAPTSVESERKRKRDLAADMAEKRIREQATRGMGRSMTEPQIIEDDPVEHVA